jgi:deazaflavin-dependent oxidoreductase (nitroreductase family)
LRGWRRLWRSLSTRRWFTPAARALVPADRLLSRITRGRVVALGMAPSLLLTTVGRRSGQRRSVVLQYLSDGAAFVVVGSNWGQPHDPAWALNLIDRPAAVVTVDGRDIPVVAQQVRGAERVALWERIVEQWPGYRGYEATAGAREIRVFRLVESAVSSGP